MASKSVDVNQIRSRTVHFVIVSITKAVVAQIVRERGVDRVANGCIGVRVSGRRIPPGVE